MIKTWQPRHGGVLAQTSSELVKSLGQPVSGPDSPDSIYETVRSNIGRGKRAIVYFAWRSFFLKGPSRNDYPLNWRNAEIGS